MVFDKIRDIIVEQLSVDKSLVTADTNLMKDLEVIWSSMWRMPNKQ